MLFEVFSVQYYVIYYLVHVKGLQSNRAQCQGHTQFLFLSLITPPELLETPHLHSLFSSSTK